MKLKVKDIHALTIIALEVNLKPKSDFLSKNLLNTLNGDMKEVALGLMGRKNNYINEGILSAIKTIKLWATPRKK